MSVCGQTEEESSSEEPAGAGASLRDAYEQKAVSKVVRVLTVLAYLLSVSLAAILLSVYYVCVWQSPKLPPANDTGDEGHPSAMVGDPPRNYTNATDFAHNATQTGGGNSTVSEAMTSPPADLASLPADSEPPDPPPSPLFDRNITLEDFNASTTVPPNDTVTAIDQR